MRLDTYDTLILIVIIAICTLLTRIIPFLIFPANRKTPKYILYLGNVLPFAIIGMLVVYCLKGITPLQYPFGLPELIAITTIVIVHKWKHRLLLSIGGGTLLYIVLVQWVFI